MPKLGILFGMNVIKKSVLIMKLLSELILSLRTYSTKALIL